MKSQFKTGDKVHNTKTKQTGFVKRRRSEGVYMVSIEGFGEQEWNEADMETTDEPKDHKWNKTWKK
jgi:hypothetical protein